MKKKGYWVIRTYESGRIGEKIKYWVPGEKPTKSARKMKSDIRKLTQNESETVRRLARLINENFTGGDVFDALTYSDEHLIRITAGMPEGLEEDDAREWVKDQAEHEAELYLRRCRYACQKAGIEFKFILITSDMDGDSKEHVRVHHHIIANAEVREIIREQWHNGGIEKGIVFYEKDHTGLAVYLMDQVQHVPDAKKYKRSRNLRIPEAKDRVAKTDKEVQPTKGAEMLYRSAYIPGRPQYIRYVLPEKEHKPKIKKQKEKES